MSSVYNGLLNVYKEPGYTSNDVVAKLRGILHQRKIGHTGTLDPDAVGVLVVCLGNGTRLCDMLTEHTKEYIAVCRLGVTTDTQDMSGTVLQEQQVNVTIEQLHAAVMAFVGDYDQIPPMYSAIKIGGRKLYDLAREGKEIERQPRRIHIDAIAVLDTSLLQSEHIFTMEVKCSKGTYIRTLCHDIGQRLGCGAAMQHLTRTAVGSFHLEDAITLGQIEQLRDEGVLQDRIQSSEQLFRDLDALRIDDTWRVQIENGNSFKPEQILCEAPVQEQDITDPDKLYEDGERVRVYGQDGTFFGIYRFNAKTISFQVEKFFFERS